MQGKYIIFLLTMLVFYSCTEDIPKYGEVLYVDNDAKTVSYKKVEIKGLTSLSEMAGDNFEYLLNVKISEKISESDLDGFDQYTATVDDINDLTYQDKGEPVNLRYRVIDDTIIPYSINDSILLTLHYNLQSAIDFFKENGLSLSKGARSDSFGQMRIFFDLIFETQNQFGVMEPMTDNAMYYPFLNSLAFLPQDTLKHLALVSNPMVITHEFSHAIFAYAAAGVMKGSDIYMDSVPKNCSEAISGFYTSGMNEGFSDYWASRKTGSADLFYLSITKEEMGVHREPLQDRSLENNRNLTSQMLILDTINCENEINSTSYYWAGTIWASSMWEAQKTSGIQDFDKYLLKSYACLYSEFSGYNNPITMATPGNCFVKTLKNEADVSSQSVQKVCDILKRRFGIIKGEFDECN